MTQEDSRPKNEDEKREEERKRMANETEDGLVEKWKGLAKLTREARKEEEERIKRNRTFITKITVIICATFMAWQLIGPIHSIVQFIKEKATESQRVAEQERKERVAIAAMQKPMTLDEIGRDGYNNLKERCATNWVYAKDFFDEVDVVRLAANTRYEEDQWFIRLDHDGYNFCKLNRDQVFEKILLFWSKRKK